MDQTARIDVEINRIRQAIAADPDGAKAAAFCAANQALSWAREPQSAAAPFEQIMGTLAGSEDCSEHSHQPQF